MQVDNGYKPLRVSVIMVWIYFSQPIISPNHPEVKMKLTCARLLIVLVL